MPSPVALALIVGVIAVPGAATALAVFRPGEISIVTRLAAAFGLGYVAAGACAFALAAAHVFRLATFLACWLLVSAALWWLAIRRAPLREHARALAAGIRDNRLPLLLGLAVIVAILWVGYGYAHLLGASRYVYYLNGMEIANAGGVPASTLEYGQSWPPATDKIFLDAFTGAAALIIHNVAVGPGVLLWVSTLGACLGLWAVGWELGLRHVGSLLPVLTLSNGVFLDTSVTTAFTEYRAEDFGRALAFCALALGIFAIRQRRWQAAVIAGMTLAAASGSHLIPVITVVIALIFFGLAELLRERGTRNRLAPLLTGLVMAGVLAVGGAAIRVFAGGAFGLTGASAPGGYRAVHTSFDPTAYLFSGAFMRRGDPAGSHWFMPPSRIINIIMSGNGISWPAWGVWLLLAGCLVTAIMLFIFGRDELRTAGIVGAGIIAVVILASLAFDYHYHVYIEATFAIRRLRESVSLGLILLGLGVAEGLILLLGRWRRQVAQGVAVAVVVSLTSWLLPVSNQQPALTQLSRERIMLVNWLRTNTPCEARLLVNQRTEGGLTSLTGRYAVLEGMGPFLRTGKLPYVIDLMLSARGFFKHPRASGAFLDQHGASYVVVARRPLLLGYAGPIGPVNVSGLDQAPFLRLVLARPWARVYQVIGAQPRPVSPLLTGPVLHCRRWPVHF